MDKFPMNGGNSSRLGTLIERRLRGSQNLFVVSIGLAEDSERKRACQEFLNSVDEMRRHVAASGVSPIPLN
jgi:hypothetical protein